MSSHLKLIVKSRKYTNMKYKICLLMVCLLFGLFSTKVQARDNLINLTVSPPTAYVKVKPGSVVTHTIIIKNNGQQTVKITPKIVDFHPDGQTGKVIISQILTFPYFKLTAGGLKPVTLAAQQKAKINLVIQAPQNALQKEYPMIVLFQASPKLEQTKTAISGTIGSNLIVFITRQNRFKSQVKVKKISSARLIDSFRPLKFTVLAENEAVEAQIASGSATIYNWRHQPVTQFQLFPISILGLSARRLETIDPKTPQTTTQLPTTSTQFTSKKRFWLGYYTISVKLKQQPAVSETVVALPISLLLLSSAGLVIFAGFNLIRKWGLHPN